MRDEMDYWYIQGKKCLECKKAYDHSILDDKKALLCRTHWGNECGFRAGGYPFFKSMNEFINVEEMTL